MPSRARMEEYQIVQPATAADVARLILEHAGTDQMIELQVRARRDIPPAVIERVLVHLGMISPQGPGLSMHATGTVVRNTDGADRQAEQAGSRVLIDTSGMSPTEPAMLSQVISTRHVWLVPSTDQPTAQP